MIRRAWAWVTLTLLPLTAFWPRKPKPLTEEQINRALLEAAMIGAKYDVPPAHLLAELDRIERSLRSLGR